MPKPQTLNKTVAFRVPDDARKSIEAAMTRERRTESDVCRALLIRGIAAYMRDGRLFEPDEPRTLKRVR